MQERNIKKRLIQIQQVKDKCDYEANGLVKGVRCDVVSIKGNWGKIPSGLICLQEDIRNKNTWLKMLGIFMFSDNHNLLYLSFVYRFLYLKISFLLLIYIQFVPNHIIAIKITITKLIK